MSYDGIHQLFKCPGQCGHYFRKIRDETMRCPRCSYIWESSADKKLREDAERENEFEEIDRANKETQY